MGQPGIYFHISQCQRSAKDVDTSSKCPMSESAFYGLIMVLNAMVTCLYRAFEPTNEACNVGLLQDHANMQWPSIHSGALPPGQQ
eukprot:scaffold558912_cov48-Prasinocladus_malaysianus.AAC.1